MLEKLYLIEQESIRANITQNADQGAINRRRGRERNLLEVCVGKGQALVNQVWATVLGVEYLMENFSFRISLFVLPQRCLIRYVCNHRGCLTCFVLALTLNFLEDVARHCHQKPGQLPWERKCFSLIRKILASSTWPSTSHQEPTLIGGKALQQQMVQDLPGLFFFMFLFLGNHEGKQFWQLASLIFSPAKGSLI